MARPVLIGHEFDRAKLMQNEQDRLMNEQWKAEQWNYDQNQRMMERMMQDQWQHEQAVQKQRMEEFVKHREGIWKDAQESANEQMLKKKSDAWFEVHFQL